MNVLVYSGSEVDQKSLEGALDLLRSVALPNYTVQPLTKASFTKEPWEIACALFVLPGLTTGTSPADVNIFTPKEVQRIRNYVEQGGAFLGFSVGARVEEQLSGLDASLSKLNIGFDGQSYINEADRRESLKFLDKPSKSFIYPVITGGFKTEAISLSEQEGQAIQVEVTDVPLGIEAQPQLFNVLATSSSGPIASHASVGKGNIALTKPRGYSEDSSPYPIIRSILTSLNLQIPSPSSTPVDLSPLPQFLTSAPSRSDARPKPLVALALRPFFFDNASSDSFASGFVKDTADTFRFISLSSSTEVLEDKVQSDGKTDDKYVIVCPDGVLPPQTHIPRFDLRLFYDTLAKLQGSDRSEDHLAWGFGELLLYSERVTSTQSMFDKNPTLLSGLPTPVLSIAAQQLAGRGRGKNVWLSPEGCLMMSLLVRINLDPGGRGSSAPSSSAKTAAAKSTKTAPAAEGTKTAKTSVVSKTTKTTESGSGPKTSSTDSTKTTKTSTSDSTKTTKTSSTDPTKTTKTSSADSTKTTKTSSSGDPSAPGLKTSAADGATKSTKTTIGPESSKTTKTTQGPLKSTGTQTSNCAFEAIPTSIISSTNGTLTANRLVFIQYLFALAVCQASRMPEVLGPELGKRVRIKWPNDLYLDLSEKGDTSNPKENLKKIGGILVNTNFAPGGKVDIVVGCGLNVLNKPPIASLAQLITRLHSESGTKHPLSLERTAAAIMTTFQRLWDEFTSTGGSFEPFLQSYYDVWLHTEQRVTVTTTTPPTEVRIVGITPDYGLLRTVRDESHLDSKGTSYGRYVYPASEGGVQYIDLQPDGNSFDLMANLIKAKTT